MGSVEFFAVSVDDTQNARKRGNSYQSIGGVNGEGVTQNHHYYMETYGKEIYFLKIKNFQDL